MEYLKVISDTHNQLYKQDSKIVVLCFDNNYLNPAINTMNSIHIHNEDICFVCLCSFLEEDNLDKLINNSTYGIRVIQIKWNKTIDTRFYSIDVAFNVYIPWILPEIKKCLYVDPDVICLKDISEIFDSTSTISMSLEISGLVNNLASNLPNSNKDNVFYYNTGVMFMNLGKIRSHYSIKQIDKEFIDKISMYYLLDQDFINDFYKNEISPLSILWNVQFYEFDGGYFYNKVIKDAYFIHFSFHKPWRYTSTFKQSKLYLRYSSDKDVVKMVKKARLKRVSFKIKKIITTPFRCIKRRIK